MTIRKLKNIDAQALEKFLSNYAETSMFLRSNASAVGLEYQEGDFYGDYWGSFSDAGNINSVLAHYWNGNIMMQSEDDVVLSNLLRVFKINMSRPVKGVLGPIDQSKAVIESLNIPDQDFAIKKSEGLYTINLDNLIVPSIAEDKYSMIDAKQLDRIILEKWFRAYEIEALGSEDNDALDDQVKQSVDRTIQGSDRWVLIVNDNPVSLSGFNARLPDIVQIGPVWTPPEHRGKGYARALVALSLRQAMKEGAQKSVLFTDNPAAIKAYEAIGFKKTGSYLLALLKNNLS